MANIKREIMATEYKRDIASVQLLVELAAEYEVTIEQCLAGSDLVLGDINNPEMEIQVSQEIAVIRNILNLLGSESNLGFIVGLRHNLRMRGVLGYAVLSSNTVREAVMILLNYMALNYSYCTIELEQNNDEAFLNVQTDSEEDVYRFLIERTFGAILSIISEVEGGKNFVKRIEFSFKPAADLSPYKIFLGKLPIFGSDKNRIVLDSKFLDLSLPDANPTAQKLCLEQCKKLQLSREIRNETTERIYKLLQNSNQIPSLTQLANSLAMSERTLRRKLKKEGTCYRQLTDEARLSLANELLNSGLAVETVAERLGFSEASSFIRAYKRWTGVTPGVGISV